MTLLASPPLSAHANSPWKLRLPWGLQQKFAVAFVVLALAAVGNIFVFRHMLEGQDHTASIIDQTGRLRMLSQRIALHAALNTPPARAALPSLLSQYEDTLRSIENATTDPDPRSRWMPESASAQVAALRQRWHAFELRVSTLLGTSVRTDADVLRKDSAVLLEQADDLVQALVQANEATLRHQRQQLLALLAFQCTLLVLLGCLVRERIVKPLRQLAGATRALAQGQFDTRATFSSADEIGGLTRAFNQTAQQLGQTVHQLAQAESMFHRLADNAIIGIYILQDERFVFANPKMADMFGRTRDWFAHRARLEDVIAPQDLAEARAQIARRLTGQETAVVYEARGQHESGRTLWLEIHGASMTLQGRTAMIGAMLDITPRKALEQARETQYITRLRHQATHDGLTGLSNRERLLDRMALATEAAAQSGRLAAVLLLDLHQFKVVNDSLGHAAGDVLLQTVAQRLQGAVRATDTVARLGGDEFVILLQGLRSADEAAAVARKVFDALAAPVKVDGRHIHVGASMGIALFPQHGTLDELLKHADLAMYQAKREGRDTFRFYKHEMGVASQRRLTLETELRRALDHGGLSLAYQPKIDLQSQRMVGAEALLRWKHPQLGNISPCEIVTLAEETGLIHPLGEWVMHTACAQLRHWQDEGRAPFTLSVNVSAKQFVGHDLVATVKRVIEATGINPRLLDLELTETVLMEHVRATEPVMQQLKDLGVTLSLDDFGTGYSSLNYLRQLPVDTVKLDRTFLSQLTLSATARTLTASIVHLAHDLGMSLVAEGVETPEQLEFLQLQGCDMGQGYLWSPPVPADELTRWLPLHRVSAHDHRNASNRSLTAA